MFCDGVRDRGETDYAWNFDVELTGGPYGMGCMIADQVQESGWRLNQCNGCIPLVRNQPRAEAVSGLVRGGGLQGSLEYAQDDVVRAGVEREPITGCFMESLRVVEKLEAHQRYLLRYLGESALFLARLGSGPNSRWG
jgi:hypothetical protein